MILAGERICGYGAEKVPDSPAINHNRENLSSHLDDFSENAKLSESVVGIEVFESESQKIVYPPGEQSTGNGF